METPVIYVWGGFRRERQRSTARLSAHAEVRTEFAPLHNNSPTGLPLKVEPLPPWIYLFR